MRIFNETRVFFSCIEYVLVVGVLKKCTHTHSHMGMIYIYKNIFGYIPPFARPEVVKNNIHSGSLDLCLVSECQALASIQATIVSLEIPLVFYVVLYYSL